jgi:N-acetylglucosaminyldiphosphoundecaprenol N-acetyl-beta-D-mannosaminyltransferase
LNANLATPDGMPVVWALRLLGQRAERVYGPDLMQAVCQRSLAEGWRHYFYGGAEGVPEMLAVALHKKFPGIQVVGTESPPFRSLTVTEEAAMLQRLNDSGADLVWVGLGSPKQDLWLAEHRAVLTAPVLIAVGAAFDFYAGRVRQAPRWMQRSGLEWLFRLGSEPGRLWRRYLIYNPKFAFKVALQVLRLRTFD